jgi:hypothetical protein
MKDKCNPNTNYQTVNKEAGISPMSFKNPDRLKKKKPIHKKACQKSKIDAKKESGNKSGKKS